MRATKDLSNRLFICILIARRDAEIDEIATVATIAIGQTLKVQVLHSYSRYSGKRFIATDHRNNMGKSFTITQQQEACGDH